MRVQRISAVTLRVSHMARALGFYRDLLGLEVIYGGKDSPFSSLQMAGSDVIINLELGPGSHDWGRIILYVDDVDELWTYLRARGFDPPHPQDGGWGERYFHMRDPDDHELSFAQRLK